MNTWLAQTAPLLVAFATTFMVMTVLMGRRSAHIRRRTHNLQTAAEIMQIHLDSMAAILEDDRVPTVLKEKLLTFSHVILDKGAFADLVLSRTKHVQVGTLWNDTSRSNVLGVLSSIDPDLATAYDTAITSAIVAMTLRNQESGWLLEDTLARVSIGAEKREIFMGALQIGLQKIRNNSTALDEKLVAVA